MSSDCTLQAMLRGATKLHATISVLYHAGASPLSWPIQSSQKCHSQCRTITQQKPNCPVQQDCLQTYLAYWFLLWLLVWFLDPWLAATTNASRLKLPKIEHSIQQRPPGLTLWWLDPHWLLRRSFAGTGPSRRNSIHSLTSLLIYTILVFSAHIQHRPQTALRTQLPKPMKGLS